MHRRQNAGRHRRVVDAVQKAHRRAEQVLARENRRPQLVRARVQRADEHADEQRDVKQLGHVEKVLFVFEQKVELHGGYVEIPKHIGEDKHLQEGNPIVERRVNDVRIHPRREVGDEFKP